MMALLRPLCTRTEGRGEARTPPRTFLSQKHASALLPLCDSTTETALSPSAGRASLEEEEVTALLAT